MEEVTGTNYTTYLVSIQSRKHSMWSTACILHYFCDKRVSIKASQLRLRIRILRDRCVRIFLALSLNLCSRELFISFYCFNCGTVGSFNLPAPPTPLQKSVRQYTSSMCIKIGLEVHCPTLLRTGAGRAGNSTEPTVSRMNTA